MASNINGIGPDKGSMADFSFYVRKDGKRVMRQKHRRVNPNERTPEAMVMRARWGNNVSAWRSFNGALKGLFEGKKPGQTDYNLFMSLNSPGEVYLKKDESDRGACVVAPFVVSDGTLKPEVEAVEQDGMLVSNLYIGSLLVGPETTVSHFDIHLGGPYGECLDDATLHFVGLSQRYASCPEAWGFSWSIELNANDFRPLMAVIGMRGTDLGLLNCGGYLAAKLPHNSMAAWVLTKKDSRGRVCVSSQKLVGTNTLLEIHSNQKARFDAIYSYGKVYINQCRPRPNRPLKYQNMPPFYPIPEEDKPQVATGPKATLTCQAVPQGSGSVEGQGVYPVGESVTIEARAAQGWRFLCWGDACTDRVREVRVEKEMTLTALFAREE